MTQPCCSVSLVHSDEAVACIANSRRVPRFGVLSFSFTVQSRVP